MSTTMAFVRMLGQWLKDPVLGPRIVPIIPDEGRTFGMEALFRKVALERLSSPEQIDSLMRVITPKAWLTLLPVYGLIALALAWGWSS